MFTGVNMFSMTSPARDRPYHHGDLRNALVRAAAALAEKGGPEAVTIRAAAREAGVTPTATYRHFDNQLDLLHAAKVEANDRMAAVILDLLDEPPAGTEAGEVAIARLRAAGRGYVRFAVTQPGLFKTAFTRASVDDEDLPPLDERLAGAAPYAFLSSVLDDLVAAGRLDPAYRPGAETGPWAAVHGLSMLLIDGPYRTLPEPEREALVDKTLDLVLHGLLAASEAVRSPS